LCKRAAKSLGYEFLGWAATYENCFTKCRLSCKKHGEWTTTTIASLFHSKSGCRKCADENIPKQEDTTAIAKFKKTGSFADTTTFLRLDKLNSYGYATYWEVTCGVCKDTYHSEYSNLVVGKIGCSCNKRNLKYSYIIELLESDKHIGNKFGISSNPERRKMVLQSSARIQLGDMRVWRFKEQPDCVSSEREVKKRLDTGFISKEILPDGYTETVDIGYEGVIAAVYESFGGKEIINT